MWLHITTLSYLGRDSEGSSSIAPQIIVSHEVSDTSSNTGADSKSRNVERLKKAGRQSSAELHPGKPVTGEPGKISVRTVYQYCNEKELDNLDICHNPKYFAGVFSRGKKGCDQTMYDPISNITRHTPDLLKETNEEKTKVNASKELNKDQLQENFLFVQDNVANPKGTGNMFKNGNYVSIFRDDFNQKVIATPIHKSIASNKSSSIKQKKVAPTESSPKNSQQPIKNYLLTNSDDNIAMYR